MDFLSFLFQIIATLVAATLLHNIWRKLCKKWKGTSSPPEPRGHWPITGHLHLLNNPNLPLHRTLANIADELGPIFTIRLGVKRALVISSWEAAKECLKTKDKAFLSRPNSASLKHMGYNGAFLGLTSYGPYWQQIRKMLTTEILSIRRLELLRHVRASQVNTGIRELYVNCTNKEKNGSNMVNMEHWFSDITMKVVVRMVVGERAFGDDFKDGLSRFSRAVKTFFYLSGLLVISDVIPFLGWLDLQGHIRSMKKNFKDMDNFMNSWLEEHLIRKDQSNTKDEYDSMDVMLSLLANEDTIEGYEKRVVIKATALNLILGGQDTTSVTLTWALSLLLNHPHALKTAQEELDNVVGQDRWVEVTDFKDLPYLQAIVKETLRLYPPGPLGVPRESIEDCYVCGYYIPKGTRLFLNMWKLNRDPRVWLNPIEFRPQRFLDNSQAQFDLRGQHLEFIAFGLGRRSCPGMYMALQTTSFVLARVLQGFNLSAPKGEPVDMSEGLGLTMPKAKPLNVILSPRLPCKRYEH